MYSMWWNFWVKPVITLWGFKYGNENDCKEEYSMREGIIRKMIWDRSIGKPLDERTYTDRQDLSYLRLEFKEARRRRESCE